MFHIERPSELVRVREPTMRAWLEARMLELFGEGLAVTFWVVEPSDAVFQVCWEACWGEPPASEATVDELMQGVEYVEAHAEFYAAVGPANHEADHVLLVPRASLHDPHLQQALQAASVNADTVLI